MLQKCFLFELSYESKVLGKKINTRTDRLLSAKQRKREKGVRIKGMWYDSLRERKHFIMITTEKHSKKQANMEKVSNSE